MQSSDEKFLESKDLLSYTKECIVKYGSYTIQDRAVPELKDGLKPVHRRILWSAFVGGYFSSSPTKKSARLVGDTIGKYHPNGDSAVYGAIVTLTKTAHPLLDSQGNFGNKITGDEPAAQRYCFTGDTLITTTNKGAFPIKDLFGSYKIDEFTEPFRVDLPNKFIVPSLFSQEKYISHAVYSGYRDIVEVITQNGNSVKCTPNQPFLVASLGGFSWKKAEDLTSEDWVCLSSITADSKRSNLTEEEALLLGLILADGWVTKYTIGFSQTTKSVNKIFKRLSTKYLGVFKEKLRTREGYKNYRQFELNSMDKVQSLMKDKYDIPPGNSQMRYVPKVIYGQPKSVVAAFLKGFFEGEGSIDGLGNIKVSNSSKELLCQINKLLIAYFGINTSLSVENKKSDSHNICYRLCLGDKSYKDIFYREIGFISKAKIRRSMNFINREYGKPSAGTKFNLLPEVIKNKSGYEVHRSYPKFIESFSSYREELQNKYKHYYTSGYKYTKVISVKPVGKDFVFDVTVPKVHAFTANGYVVHNTECRLSSFAEKYLLDKDYIAVTPMVDNYDGKEKEPVYLPAKLPVILTQGIEGIATGASTVIPSFSLESVLKLTRKALKHGSCTVKMCLSTLSFKFPEGGEVWASPEELETFYRTGEAKLFVVPKCVYEENSHSIALISFAPRLKLETIFQAGLEVDGVLDVEDATGFNKKEKTSSGTKILFHLRKSLSKKASLAKVKELQEKLGVSVPYSIMVTDRKDNGEDVEFSYSSIPEIVNSWINWRLSFEVKVVSRLISLEEKKQEKLSALLWALDNLDLIFQALKSKAPEELLTAKAGVSPSLAKFILDQPLRRLASLEREPLASQLQESSSLKEALKLDVASDLALRKRVFRALKP